MNNINIPSVKKVLNWEKHLVGSRFICTFAPTKEKIKKSYRRFGYDYEKPYGLVLR